MSQDPASFSASSPLQSSAHAPSALPSTPQSPQLSAAGTESSSSRRNFFQALYATLLVVWVVAFGVEAAGVTRHLTRIARATRFLELNAQQLDRDSGDVVHLVNELKSQSREMDFLQTLPNILPQDKGYLRTQKAIVDEVQKLRRKVRQKLEDSLHIIVDGKANKLYLKKGVQLLWEADCSVGRGGMLADKVTGRKWEFVTPRGEFRVLGKRPNPVWTKPDWAFVEAGEPVPPPDDPSRKVPGELGAYVLNLGDGYLIHGTKNEDLLGRPVSHGCVRLGADNLKKLYDTVPVGTRVYIIY